MHNNLFLILGAISDKFGSGGDPMVRVGSRVSIVERLELLGILPSFFLVDNCLCHYRKPLQYDCLLVSAFVRSARGTDLSRGPGHWERDSPSALLDAA